MRVGNFDRNKQLAPLKARPQGQTSNSSTSRIEKSSDNAYSINSFLINTKSLLPWNMGKRIIPEGIDNHLILGSLSAQRLPKAPNNNNSPIINSFYKISSQLSHPTLPPYRISNDSPLLQKYNSESPFPMRIRTDSPDIFEDKSLAKYQATVGRRSLKSREPAYATSLELPSFRVENLKRESSEPRSSKRIDTINQQTHSDFRTSRASINRSISSFVGRNGETSTANVQHQLIKIFPKRKPSAKAESKSQRISQFPKEIYESLKLERQRSSRRSEEDSAVRSYVSIVMSSAINRRNLHLDISENLKIALNRRIDAAFNRERKDKLRAILEKENTLKSYR